MGHGTARRLVPPAGARRPTRAQRRRATRAQPGQRQRAGGLRGFRPGRAGAAGVEDDAEHVVPLARGDRVLHLLRALAECVGREAPDEARAADAARQRQQDASDQQHLSSARLARARSGGAPGRLPRQLRLMRGAHRHRHDENRRFVPAPRAHVRVGCAARRRAGAGGARERGSNAPQPVEGQGVLQEVAKQATAPPASAARGGRTCGGCPWGSPSFPSWVPCARGARTDPAPPVRGSASPACAPHCARVTCAGPACRRPGQVQRQETRFATPRAARCKVSLQYQALSLVVALVTSSAQCSRSACLLLEASY